MLDAALDHAPAASTEVRLHTLERLLAIRTTDLAASLRQAADLIVETFAAEKVDVFLHHAASATLVAEGTSDTAMGREQHRLGLHRLPLANGGSAVRVFQTGQPHLTSEADREGELAGLVHGLGIRSEIIAPLDIRGLRRGVLLASSRQPQYFDEHHLRLLGTVARWIGLVAEQRELTQQLATHAAMRERYATAEELLAVVAHDLRNYLAPLRGRLDLLRRRALAAGHEDHARDAASAVVGVDRLGRLVDDLLDTERLERGLFEVRPEALELVALVRDVTDRFATERVSIEVQAPDEIWVAADPRRVRQALENVVANAVKHSPPNGRVTIELSNTARRGATGAQISIQDEGPGVPSELVPRLFERFGRSGSSAGLGLGLFIASRVAQAHGGSLTLDSMPDSPARFSLWLPVTPS